MPPVRAAVPGDRAVRAGAGADRRQYVQGGNNPDKNFTPHKLKARQQQLDQSIEKRATVRAQMKKLEAIGRHIEVAPDQQISLTNPGARSMATSGRAAIAQMTDRLVEIADGKVDVSEAFEILTRGIGR